MKTSWPKASQYTFNHSSQKYNEFNIKLLGEKVERMYLWLTSFLLKAGQSQLPVSLLTSKHQDTTRGIRFSLTSSKRWTPKLCLLCSWSNWLLLKELIFNTHPATCKPLSAEPGDLSLQADTHPGPRTHQGLCRAAEQEDLGQPGPQVQPTPQHQQLMGCQAGPESRRTALTAGQATARFVQPCLGGFCWRSSPGLWGR